MVNIYEIENYNTRKCQEVEAGSLEEACKKAGWKVEDSYLHRVNFVASRKERLGW
jgi:hypothetical protein